jgi:hypothetical protein
MTEQIDDAIEEAERLVARLHPSRHARYNPMNSSPLQRLSTASSTVQVIHDASDDLRAMRGIATSVRLSVPLWIAVVLVIWMM